MRTKNSLLLGAILLATMGLGTWFSLRRDVSKSDDFHEREIHQEQAGDALVAGDAPANADTVPDSEAAFQLNDPRHLALPSALVGLKVLQERKEAHPGGGIRRVRLLEDPENEPNPIRLEEVLLQEADGSWLRRGFEAMVANRVLVGSEDPAWLEAFSRIQPEGLFAIERKLPHSPVWLVRINQLDIDAVPEALSRLKPLLGTVGYVEPDHLNFPLLLPDDTLWSSLWAMPKIDAPTAWDTTTGDPGVVVAVLDTGTRITHEELRNTVWVNHREIPGNGIDDDYNGYIDDLNGWNVDDDNGDLSDVSGHGTHVSGTMAAEGNNGTGVAGVAWGHKLMVMAAGSGFSTSETAEALDYMVFMKTHRGVNVVASNHSYGSLHTDSTYAGSSTRRAAIARARDAGILFIAAGGNDGKKLEGTSDVDGDGTWYNHYPSSQSVLDYPHTGDWDSVIAVAASTSSDDVAGFSNWGLDRGDGTMVIDLTAPGVGIRSTAMGSDSSYGNKQGTSMASPHVTGAAGLVASANSSLGAAQLKDILMASVDAASAWSTRCESGGRLNVGTAVATAQTYPEVAISNLQDGHYVEAGTPLLVEVDASDSQGSIVGVSLYREGDTNPLAVDSDGSDGWQLTWASVPAGNHTLYATATNSAGKTSIPDRRVRNIFTGEAIATSQDGFYPGSYWYFSSGSGWSGVYGTQLRYFDLLAEETQTYVIPVYTPQGGNYEVFAWWPGTWTKTLADSVPISIPHLYGTAEVVVNQQENSGQWVSLGTFALPGQSKIPVTFSTANAEAGQTVVANAVRALYRGPLNKAPEVTLLEPARSLVAIPSGVGVLLAVSASDEDDPEGTSLSYAWTQVTGPGTALIEKATAPETGVTFPTAGLYRFVASVSDGDLEGTVEVGVWVGQALAAGYRESQGLVVMEAEAATRTVAGIGPADGVEWSESTTTLGFSGASYLEATPNSGVSVQDNLTGPRLEFDVNFANTGTYHVWVRMAGYSGNDDSVHVAVDGQALTYGRSGLSQNGTWDWEGVFDSEPVSFSVAEPGMKTITVAMREDGVRVDKLVLSTESTYIPDWLGPEASVTDPAYRAGLLTAGGDPPASVEESIDLQGIFTPHATTPPGAPEFSWEQVSGPAPVAFTQSNSLATTVTFPGNGVYQLRLSAHDGVTTIYDTIEVTVSGGSVTTVASYAAGFGLSGDDAEPGSDSDGDGLEALLEFALKTNMLEDSSGQLPVQSIEEVGPHQHLAISYRRYVGGSGQTGINYTANGLRYCVEVKSVLNGLSNWQSGSGHVLPVGDPSDNGDGTETVLLRAADPLTEIMFIRLKVEAVSGN